MNGYDLRIASWRDKEYIEAMCLKFFQEAPHSTLKDPYSPERVSTLVDSFIKGPHEERIIFLLVFKDKPIGMLAALAYPNLFTDTFVSLEQIWWVDKEHRGQTSTALIDMYEIWAKKVGCSSCIVSSLNTEHAKLLDRFYSKRGYIKTETSYTKDLA